MLLRLSSSGRGVVAVDESGRVFSAGRGVLKRFLRGEFGDYFMFTRLAREDGFLRDLDFSCSDVYFVDRGEKLGYDEAVGLLGDGVVDDALKRKAESEERRERIGLYREGLEEF